MDAATIASYDAHRSFHNKPFRSACYAGHTSMVFDSIGRIRVCCGNSEYILGDIREERLDDIWNGPRLARMREALNAYNLSLGCAVCQHKIMSGVVEGSSLRTTQLIALKYEDLDVEPEAPYWPKHLEFHLSNKCNLQCVTCFGEFSSLIRQNRDKLPPYPAAYDERFFADLRKYLPHVRWAQFLGGEPFLIPEMYRVWDMLIEERLTPACHVTTNGTVFGPKVERVLELLPMSVTVSMDGATAATFESIRVNANFDRVLANFRRFKETCQARGQWIGINFTLSRLNWHEFIDLLLFAEAENVDVSASEVYYPEALSLFSLELDEVRRITDALEARAAEVADRLPRNRQLLANRIRELRHHLAECELRQARWVLPSRPSLVSPFRESVPSPSGMDGVHHAAACRLQAWSQGGRYSEILVDVNDIIVSASLELADAFGELPDVAGRPLSDWVKILSQRLGPSIVHLELDRQPSCEDRTMRFEGEGGRTLLRVISMPCFDVHGRLNGARALFAIKQDSEPDSRLRVPPCMS